MFFKNRQDQSPGNHGNAGLDPVTFKCELDPKLTEKDLPFFIPDIQGTWGSACGRNRGVFVVDPPDGHTYGEFNSMYIYEVYRISRRRSVVLRFVRSMSFFVAVWRVHSCADFYFHLFV